MTRVVINGESLYSSSCHRLRAEVPSNVRLVRLVLLVHVAVVRLAHADALLLPGRGEPREVGRLPHGDLARAGAHRGRQAAARRVPLALP